MVWPTTIQIGSSPPIYNISISASLFKVSEPLLYIAMVSLSTQIDPRKSLDLTVLEEAKLYRTGLNTPYVKPPKGYYKRRQSYVISRGGNVVNTRVHKVYCCAVDGFYCFKTLSEFG